MSSEATRRSVLVVGSANMDMVVSTRRFPKPGETVLGGDFGMYPGGKGANQAVACARLGGDVAFLAKMGRDLFRERLFESLENDGVDTTNVLIDADAPTGIALITVDASGQNEIVVVSGSNMKMSPDDIEANDRLFDEAALVMLQLEIPLATVVRAAALAREREARVILNPAPAAELPDELLESMDVLTPNESEAELLTGKPVTDMSTAVSAARKLIDRGVRNVLLTLGERGAIHVTSDLVQAYPAYRVQPVDTTAAGDAFNGALAFALSRGDALDASVPFANAAAACCVRRMGAQTSMPSLAEVEELQIEHPNTIT